MKKYFESDEILLVIWKWKKHLLIVFTASLLGAVIFSSPMFIKPKYKSFLRAYPHSLKTYSEESPSEQMLQILESDSIREKLVSKFDLYKHYEIGSDNIHKKDLLVKAYSENVEFKKTKFESVEISVLDISPDTAYLILQEIVDQYNYEVKRMQDAQLIEAVKTLKVFKDQKEIEVKQYESEIDTIRLKYGILDYTSQVKNLNKEYYKLMARKQKDPNKIKAVKNELNRLKEKGGEFQRISGLLFNARKELAALRVQYEKSYNELMRKKSYANIVVNGYVADKKVYPVRWLIVVATIGVTMVFAFGFISFAERFEKRVYAKK